MEPFIFTLVKTRELFFVFDDDIAQQLYRRPEFKIKDVNTRRAFVSVGNDRFIHQRTLNFSKSARASGAAPPFPG